MKANIIGVCLNHLREVDHTGKREEGIGKRAEGRRARLGHEGEWYV